MSVSTLIPRLGGCNLRLSNELDFADSKEHMPKISVVIPAYNGANFLAESLSSLARQTFRDFEVVLVDDGSSDGTAEIADRFSGEMRMRVLVNSKNIGVAASLNRGIAETDSLLIARLDSDDLAHPDRLNQQFTFMEASPDMGVY